MKAGPTVTLPCTTCGKPVVKRLSDYQRNTSGRVFCGVECLRVVGPKPRRGDLKFCELCGAEFYAAPASAGRKQARFCGIGCHNESQRKKSVGCTCVVCGKTFRLSQSQLAFRGGDPLNVTCSRACDRLRRTKNGVGRFHNGREVVRRSTGYLHLYQPDHPAANEQGWVLEHRWLVEQRIGRYLATEEHVHHVNGIKDDNRSDNLVVLSHSEHSSLTNQERLGEIAAMRAELEEYRRRVGPLD